MKVFIFTEAFADKDGDLDLQDIKVFTNESEARKYYERSHISLESAGYGECWHEEYEKEPYIMQTYYKDSSTRCNKLLSLTLSEV